MHKEGNNEGTEEKVTGRLSRSRSDKPKLTKEEKKAAKKQKKAELKALKKADKAEWKAVKKKRRKTVRGRIGLTFKVMLLTLLTIILLAGGYVAWYLYDTYWDVATEAYDNSREKIANLDHSIFSDKKETIIYDKDDNILAELSVHEYEYLPFDSIPDYVKHATIAVEDERFLEHEGVDYKSLARAGYQLVKNKGKITQGGSTITQQLIKTTMLTHEQTFSRKFEEIFIAIELEKQIPKQKILEYYLNNIYYGHGAYGIESASRYYFSKPSSELTIAESAFLMALPNNPSLFDPFVRKDNTIKRQTRILKKMYEQEYITKQEFTDATLQPIEMKVTERIIKPETYLVSYAISDATKQLMKANGFVMQNKFESDEEMKEYQASYSETFKKYNEDIRNGGYIIHTSLDQKMQDTAQGIVNSTMKYAKAKNSETGLYKRQASSVILDNDTGLVQAIIGGRTQEDVNNTFNRGFLAFRQPGSTIKPILAYTQAFETKYYPSSIVIDSKDAKGPSNVNHQYIGKTTIQNAVNRSYNTIPYKLIQEFGVKESLNYLKEMNFSKIVKEDEVPVVSIGGMTYGVSPLELASAYSTLARNGEFLDPTSIITISRTSKTLIYEYKKTPKQVYDAGASYIMTQVLTETAKNKSRKGLSGVLDGYITASKTGTTNDTKDIWYAGYSPYYTMVVWVGEDTPKHMPNNSSYDDPLVIWSKTMTKIHEGKPKVSAFKKPEDALFQGYVNPKNGRVSYTHKSGWRQELIPTSRMKKQEEADRQAKLEADKKAEERRKKEEEVKKQKEAERKKQEAIRLQQEKELDEYLQAQGSSLSEEKRKAKEVESLLNELKRYQVYNRSAYDYADSLTVDTQRAIDVLLHVDNIEKYQSLLNKEMDRVAKQKDKVERAIIVKEEQAERDKIRAEEARLKEEERKRLQAQLERETEAERKRLEEEKRKQEELEKQQAQEEENQVTDEPIADNINAD